MEKPTIKVNKDAVRRQRQHELLIALIKQQDCLELMDSDGPDLDFQGRHGTDPGEWMERNRRILAKYQSLVNTSITLDAMLDSEAIKSD